MGGAATGFVDEIPEMLPLVPLLFGLRKLAQRTEVFVKLSCRLRRSQDDVN